MNRIGRNTAMHECGCGRHSPGDEPGLSQRLGPSHRRLGEAVGRRNGIGPFSPSHPRHPAPLCFPSAACCPFRVILPSLPGTDTSPSPPSGLDSTSLTGRLPTARAGTRAGAGAGASAGNRRAEEWGPPRAGGGAGCDRGWRWGRGDFRRREAGPDVTEGSGDVRRREAGGGAGRNRRRGRRDIRGWEAGPDVTAGEGKATSGGGGVPGLQSLGLLGLPGNPGSPFLGASLLGCGFSGMFG